MLTVVPTLVRFLSGLFGVVPSAPTITISAHLCSITSSVCILNVQRIWLSPSYHWFSRMSVPLFRTSRLFFYFSCASLLHSLVKCATVSSMSLHILHFTSSSCLSIFTLMTLVLNAWSCAAVRNPSVSFFGLPDATHVQLFESATSRVCLRNCPWSGFVTHLSLWSCLSLCWVSVSPFQTISTFSSLVAFSGSYSLVSTYLLRLCSFMFTESWMLASPLPPSVLGTFKRSTSALGCRLLYIVVNFLVRLFIASCSCFSI